MANRSSFYGQISANKRNSFLLAAGVVALFAVLGFTIGYAIVGTPAGAVGVMALALAVGAISGIGDLLQRGQAGARGQRGTTGR